MTRSLCCPIKDGLYWPNNGRLLSCCSSVSQGDPSRTSYFLTMQSVEKDAQGVNQLWLKTKKKI